MKKISKVLVLSLMMSILCTFNIFAEDNVTFTDVPINSPYYTVACYKTSQIDKLEQGSFYVVW